MATTSDGVPSLSRSPATSTSPGRASLRAFGGLAVLVVPALTLLTSCTDEGVETEAPLELRDGDREEASPMCEEPEEPDEVPREVLERPPSPPAPVAKGAWTRGGQLHFDVPAQREIVTVYEHLVDPDDRPTKVVTHEVGGQHITVVTAGATLLRPGRDETVIVVPGDDLNDFHLAMDVSVLPDSDELWFADIRVEDEEGQAAGHASNTNYASEPYTCAEIAILRFGSIPAGMPAFHWPINKNCGTAKCIQVRTAYMHALHSTWRMTQMLDPIAEFPSYSKSWAWDQPAANAAGLSAGEETSLRYYFGSYKDERYETVRRLYRDHLNVLRSARMDGIKLRLKCPEKSTHGGNGCFSSDSWAHHVVKGWVNMCPVLWNDLNDSYPNDSENWLRWFDHTLAHEFFHHHFAKIDGVGWRMLQDLITHKHGKSCTKLSTDNMVASPGDDPFDKNIRHLAGWNNSDGEHCGHRRMALRNLDQYNTAARVIGERIRSGDVVWWPLVEPTPQPPTCVGGENCLCETFDPEYDHPDGDFSDEHLCTDNGQILECMTRSFGAGNPVGICTDCETIRGPGCECRDGLKDCEVGSCYGDDTNGDDVAWGKCFVEPPSYDCLVDCEELLGDDAFCLWDHPDWARCVTGGTQLAEAGECWLDGGHMNMNGDCTQVPECGSGAPDHNGTSGPDCQDLGYPVYFQCDSGTHRCVVTNP